MITDYGKFKINGLCYVRELKKAEVIKKGNKVKTVYTPNGYLIIGNDNKPIRNAYYFIKARADEGDALNTIKRKCHDLCYFFNFLTVNNIDEELLDKEYLNNFISEYLLKVDPSFRYRDCIEKSMAKEIPVLPQYKNEKVIAYKRSKKEGPVKNEKISSLPKDNNNKVVTLSKNIKNVDEEKERNNEPLSNQTIVKILTSTKEYLVWLAVNGLANVDLDECFTLVNAPAHHRKGGDYMLNHLAYNDVLQVYSITGLLKKAKIPYKSERTTPVEENAVFQHNERDAFFEALNRKYNPSYQLLFYLLSVTGLRISEALALKIDLEFIGKDFDLENSQSDIYLKNDKKDIWQIKIVVRKDNPSDLSIKFNKPREIIVIDKTKTLKNLIKSELLYRTFKMKKKRVSHDFLFINERGGRLKYQTTRKTFEMIKKEIKLGKQKEKALVIHSFRHTFASEWIEVNQLSKNDVELAELSKYLGHAHVATTQKVYIHFFNKARERMVSKLDDARHQKKEEYEASETSKS